MVLVLSSTIMSQSGNKDSKKPSMDLNIGPPPSCAPPPPPKK
jgi:hypothetical protein